MKKSILILAFIGVLVSCKKEEVAEEFEATDQTGTTVIKGMITKPQSTGSNVPAAGVSISVKVNNTELYPNSPTATGSQVFSGTTDVNGYYSISVKTVGGNGVNALVTINNSVGTFDPVNGTQALFSGTSTNFQLISNVTKDYNYLMTSTTIGSPVITGTAVVSGTLKVMHYEEAPAGVYTLKAYNLANHTILLDFDKDPTTQLVKTYSTTTDASGNYSFTVTTTAAAGYNNTAKLYAIDYPTTQDTIKIGGTTVTGKAGYFGNTSMNVPGGPINPTEIRNANTLTYSSFFPN